MTTPIVVTAENSPPPVLDAILFQGVVDGRVEAISPLLDEGNNLYQYQVLSTGDMVSPAKVKPVKSRQAAA